MEGQNISRFGCFNPQASYEARRKSGDKAKKMLEVSIHRPHTRPDDNQLHEDAELNVFQSTGLIRGPTDRRLL